MARRAPPRTVKISVTVDRGVLADLKKRLRGGEGSLSGFVSDAVAYAIRRQSMRALLDDIDRELGPVPESARREAREKLAAALGRRPRRRAA